MGRDAPPAGWPAVVLVPGPSTDRDGTLAGVPIFAQLAAALSEAGQLVVRYDPRGVGQSGGRPESARMRDYAEDVRDLVRYLRDRRRDVDRDRIVAVGHDEGGWIALAAAARERRIGAVALLAVPGLPGEELTLERQRAELTRMAATPAERRERVELQRRLHAALLRDGPWDGIPDDVRRQADTDWFRSFLRFDPRDAIRRMRQPILVLHGELDRQVPAHHAERLVELVRDRGRSEVERVEAGGGQPPPGPGRYRECCGVRHAARPAGGSPRRRSADCVDRRRAALGACAAERQRSACRGASSQDGGGWGRPGACDGLAAVAP